VGNYTNDTVIKTKVKTALLRAKGLKSRDLDVEVVGGEVLVSGFVRDEAQRGIALAAASRVGGVTSVKDAMYVR
jgi:osmotically-inducible protein OsmY